MTKHTQKLTKSKQSGVC